MTAATEDRIAELQLQVERVSRVAAAAFEAILGDRIYSGVVPDYPCPDCDGEPAQSHDYQFQGRICESCNGRGRINLRQQAGLDLWNLRNDEKEVT